MFYQKAVVCKIRLLFCTQKQKEGEYERVFRTNYVANVSAIQSNNGGNESKKKESDIKDKAGTANAIAR